MKKYLFPVVALVAAMASCTSDVEDATVSEQTNKSKEYAISVKPFEFVDGLTRTHLILGNNGLNFGWDFNETFGVYPIAPYENDQAKWNLQKADATGCEGDNYAHFRGQGWQLQADVTYAAYQPYTQTTASYTEVPVALSSSQDGRLSEIDNSEDYMWATGKYEEPDENGHTSKVVFDFSHAIAIVQIQVPANIVDGIYVTADEGNPFITSGTMNAATGAVTAVTSTNKISLSDPEKVENGVATFYLAAFPTTTGACTITVDGNTYQVASKKLEAGKAYRWICQ